MILLLMGLVCFGAALKVAREGAEEARHDVRGAGAAAWMGLLALLILAQLASGAGSLDGYRLTLLGFRFGPAPESPAGEELVVGGSHEAADLWVPGAGDRSVARLRWDTAGGVRAVRVDDANAVALVEEPGLRGAEWRVLGARSVGPADTVTVAGDGVTFRLLASTIPDTLELAGRGVPLPWVREHAFRDVDAVAGNGAGTVRLPGVERGPLARLRPYHPSVFQRTYPLADVLAALEADAGARLPALSSFFFYRDGALRLADLDSEVSVAGEADAVHGPVPPGGRLLVAALPLRDYPEPDLELPERYGVRPLRAFRLETDGAWLDAALTSPETRALDRDELEELRLPGARDAEGAPVYRIRLASARDALARRAVTFDAAPGRFAVPGQAVLSLPVDPGRGEVEVLTPSGLARWETGRPLTLGTGDRRLLVRVDGLDTSAAFWWVYAALLALPVTLVLLRPMTGPVFALALAATGLAGFRLILSLSAMAEPPHVMEAQQLALWLLPFLPWVVVVAGEVARGQGEREDGAGPPAREAGPWGGEAPEPADGSDGSRNGWVGRGFHGGYALALVALAAILVPESGVKAAALSLLALATAGTWWGLRSGVLDPGAPRRRLSALLERRGAWLRGWSLGSGLLVMRALLELLGVREQLTLAGTRVGVSVVYTPLFVAAMALVLARAARDLGRTWGSAGFPAMVARTLLDVGAFLVLALLAVSAWISDFGIALALLPGALALVALFGLRWAPGGRAGVLTATTLALPLVLLALVQVAPPLLRFAWGGDLQAVDARLGEWNRNELLLLERGDPAGLAMIGQRRSEALAVMRETMRSYTRGNPLGKGFLGGRISGAVAETATREHTVSALLASQFGLPGTVGLVLVLLALLPPALELLRNGRRSGPPGRAATRAAGLLALALALLVAAAYLLPSPFNALLVGLAVAAAVAALVAPAFGRMGAWKGGRVREGVGVDRPGPAPFRHLLAASALLAVALAGLYMVLANYGLVFFTGKNVYVLGLDSLGDALEAAALLALAGLALGAETAAGGERTKGPGAGTTAVEPAGVTWWHPSDSAEEGRDGATGGES